MDKIDLIILKELQQDARKSLNEISQSVNLSLPAVSERVRKLERAHVIERYTAILNPKKFDKTFICYCFLNLRGKSAQADEQFYEFVRSEPDIISCQCLTGQYEYILKIMTDSAKSMEKLLSKMRHDAIAKLTNTFVVLSTIKDEPSISPSALPTEDTSKKKPAK